MHWRKAYLPALAFLCVIPVLLLVDSFSKESMPFVMSQAVADDIHKNFEFVFTLPTEGNEACAGGVVSLHSLASALHGLADSSRAFLGLSFGTSKALDTFFDRKKGGLREYVEHRKRVLSEDEEVSTIWSPTAWLRTFMSRQQPLLGKLMSRQPLDCQLRRELVEMVDRSFPEPLAKQMDREILEALDRSGRSWLIGATNAADSTAAAGSESALFSYFRLSEMVIGSYQDLKTHIDAIEGAGASNAPAPSFLPARADFAGRQFRIEWRHLNADMPDHVMFAPTGKTEISARKGGGGVILDAPVVLQGELISVKGNSGTRRRLAAKIRFPTMLVCREAGNAGCRMKPAGDRYDVVNAADLLRSEWVGPEVARILKSYELAGVFGDRDSEGTLALEPEFSLLLGDQRMLSGLISSTSSTELLEKSAGGLFDNTAQVARRLSIGDVAYTIVSIDRYQVQPLRMRAHAVNRHSGSVHRLEIASNRGRAEIEDLGVPGRFRFYDALGGPPSVWRELSAVTPGSFSGLEAAYLAAIRSALEQKGIAPDLANVIEFDRYPGGVPCEWFSFDIKGALQADDVCRYIGDGAPEQLLSILSRAADVHALSQAVDQVYRDWRDVVFGLSGTYRIQQPHPRNLSEALFGGVGHKDFRAASQQALRNALFGGTAYEPESELKTVLNRYCRSISDVAGSCYVEWTPWYRRWLDALVGVLAINSSHAAEFSDSTIDNLQAEVVKSALAQLVTEMPGCGEQNHVSLANSVYITLAASSAGCLDGLVPVLTDAFLTDRTGKPEFLTGIPYYFWQKLDGGEHSDTEKTDELDGLRRNLLSSAYQAKVHAISSLDGATAEYETHFRAVRTAGSGVSFDIGDIEPQELLFGTGAFTDLFTELFKEVICNDDNVECGVAMSDGLTVPTAGGSTLNFRSINEIVLDLAGSATESEVVAVEVASSPVDNEALMSGLEFPELNEQLRSLLVQLRTGHYLLDVDPRTMKVSGYNVLTGNKVGPIDYDGLLAIWRSMRESVAAPITQMFGDLAVEEHARKFEVSVNGGPNKLRSSISVSYDGSLVKWDGNCGAFRVSPNAHPVNVFAEIYRCLPLEFKQHFLARIVELYEAQFGPVSVVIKLVDVESRYVYAEDGGDLDEIWVSQHLPYLAQVSFVLDSIVDHSTCISENWDVRQALKGAEPFFSLRGFNGTDLPRHRLLLPMFACTTPTTDDPGIARSIKFTLAATGVVDALQATEIAYSGGQVVSTRTVEQLVQSAAENMNIGEDLSLWRVYLPHINKDINLLSPPGLPDLIQVVHKGQPLVDQYIRLKSLNKSVDAISNSVQNQLYGWEKRGNTTDLVQQFLTTLPADFGLELDCASEDLQSICYLTYRGTDKKQLSLGGLTSEVLRVTAGSLKQRGVRAEFAAALSPMVLKFVSDFVADSYGIDLLTGAEGESADLTGIACGDKTGLSAVSVWKVEATIRSLVSSCLDGGKRKLVKLLSGESADSLPAAVSWIWEQGSSVTLSETEPAVILQLSNSGHPVCSVKVDLNSTRNGDSLPDVVQDKVADCFAKFAAAVAGTLSSRTGLDISFERATTDIRGEFSVRSGGKKYPLDNSLLSNPETARSFFESYIANEGVAKSVDDVVNKLVSAFVTWVDKTSDRDPVTVSVDGNVVYTVDRLTLRRQPLFEMGRVAASIVSKWADLDGLDCQGVGCRLTLPGGGTLALNLMEDFRSPEVLGQRLAIETERVFRDSAVTAGSVTCTGSSVCTFQYGGESIAVPMKTVLQDPHAVLTAIVNSPVAVRTLQGLPFVQDVRYLRDRTVSVVFLGESVQVTIDDAVGEELVRRVGQAFEGKFKKLADAECQSYKRNITDRRFGVFSVSSIMVSCASRKPRVSFTVTAEPSDYQRTFTEFSLDDIQDLESAIRVGVEQHVRNNLRHEWAEKRPQIEAKLNAWVRAYGPYSLSLPVNIEGKARLLRSGVQFQAFDDGALERLMVDPGPLVERVAREFLLDRLRLFLSTPEKLAVSCKRDCRVVFELGGEVFAVEINENTTPGKASRELWRSLLKSENVRKKVTSVVRNTLPVSEHIEFATDHLVITVFSEREALYLHEINRPEELKESLQTIASKGAVAYLNKSLNSVADGVRAEIQGSSVLFYVNNAPLPLVAEASLNRLLSRPDHLIREVLLEVAGSRFNKEINDRLIEGLEVVLRSISPRLEVEHKRSGSSHTLVIGYLSRDRSVLSVFERDIQPTDGDWYQELIGTVTKRVAIYVAQDELLAVGRTQMANICSSLDLAELRFPSPVVMRCDDGGQLRGEFELLGRAFTISGGIELSPSNTPGELLPSIDYENLQIFPSLESVFHETYRNYLPDLKITDIDVRERAISIELSYFVSQLGVRASGTLVLSKDGLETQLDFSPEKWIRAETCRYLGKYIADHPETISGIYENMFIAADPTCSAHGDLNIPIIVILNTEFGSLEVPGGVSVAWDGGLSAYINTAELLSIEAALKSYLGGINVGGTELIAPYYLFEDGQLAVFLRSSIKTDFLEGMGSMSAEYAVSRKGLKIRGNIEFVSDHWIDLEKLSIGRFGLSLNPELKELSLLGSATVSPGDLNGDIARFNGVATIPLDKVNYIRFSGELWTKATGTMSKGSACIGEAGGCRITDEMAHTNLADVSLTQGIPGLELVRVNGNLRIKDHDTEFIRVSADATMLGAKLAEAKLRLGKDFSGEFSSYADLKLLDISGDVSVMPGLVLDSFAFSGNVEGLFRVSGKAALRAGVTATIDPEGALDFVPKFSLTVEDFSELTEVLLALLAIDPTQVDLRALRDARLGASSGSSGSTSAGGSDGGSNRESQGGASSVAPPIAVSAVPNVLNILYESVPIEGGCTWKESYKCNKFLGIFQTCTQDRQDGHRPRAESDVTKFFADKYSLSKKCEARDHYSFVNNYRRAEQQNGYSLDRKGDGRFTVMHGGGQLTLSGTRGAFKDENYLFAVPYMEPDQFAVVHDAAGEFSVLKSGDPIPSHKDFARIKDARNLPRMDHFLQAYQNATELEDYQKFLLGKLALSRLAGISFSRSASVLDDGRLTLLEIGSLGDSGLSDEKVLLSATAGSFSFQVLSNTLQPDALHNRIKGVPVERVLDALNCPQSDSFSSDCGAVVDLNGYLLFLATYDLKNGAPALVLDKNGWSSKRGTWRLSGLAVRVQEEIGIGGLLTEKRKFREWDTYLQTVIEKSVLNDGFFLMVGAPKCELTGPLETHGDCVLPDFAAQTGMLKNERVRFGLLNGAGEDSRISLHSRFPSAGGRYCFQAASSTALQAFWGKKTFSNETRQEVFHEPAEIGPKQFMEIILDEGWISPEGESGPWWANPLTAFEVTDGENLCFM